MSTPIASGREADVFALDSGRVLRRYRRVADVTGEAEAMAYVAGLGFPVPEVFAQVAVEGSHPFAGPAGAFLDAFLRLAPGDPLRLLDEATALRSRQLDLGPAGTGALSPAVDRVRAGA